MVWVANKQENREAHWRSNMSARGPAGPRPRPPSFCVKSAGAPEAGGGGGDEACNTDKQRGQTCKMQNEIFTFDSGSLSSCAGSSWSSSMSPSSDPSWKQNWFSVKNTQSSTKQIRCTTETQGECWRTVNNLHCQSSPSADVLFPTILRWILFSSEVFQIFVCIYHTRKSPCETERHCKKGAACIHVKSTVITKV